MKSAKKYLALTGMTVMLMMGTTANADDGPGKEKGKWKGKHGWNKSGDWNKGGGKRHEKMMEKLEDLGLSEEQRTKIKALHQEHRAEMDERREAMKASKKAFRNAMNAGDKSDDELTTLHEKIVSDRTDEMRMRFKHMLQIRSVLTQDQRTKFRGMLRDGPEDRDGSED